MARLPKRIPEESLHSFKFRIDRPTWDAFKAVCAREAVMPGRLLRRFIVEWTNERRDDAVKP